MRPKSERVIFTPTIAQRPLIRLIAALERTIIPHLPEAEEYEPEGFPYQYQVEDMIRQAEKEAGLEYGWKLNCRLIDMYNWKEDEINLLKDLRDAGGKSTSRSIDKRFDGLGQGEGGKGAIGLSAQGNRWTVRLTDRGNDLIDDWDAGEG